MRDSSVTDLQETPRYKIENWDNKNGFQAVLLYFSRAMRCIWADGSSWSSLLSSPSTGDCWIKRGDPLGGRDKTLITEENFHISKKNCLQNLIWITPRKGKERKRRRWSWCRNQNLSKVTKCILNVEHLNQIKLYINDFLSQNSQQLWSMFFL